MRTTVLCLLAIVGATCALNIPSLLSPKSAIDRGTALLNGNLPKQQQAASQSSDSSSSSSQKDDKNTQDLAKELAQKLIENAEHGVGSMVQLPLKLATGGVKSFEDVAKNWLGEVLNPDQMRDEAKVAKAAGEMAKKAGSVMKDSIENAGVNLLRPVKLKANIIDKIAQAIAGVIKDLLGSGSSTTAAPSTTARPSRPSPSRPATSSSAAPSTTARPSRPSPSRPATSSSAAPSTTARPSRPSPSSRPTSPRLTITRDSILRSLKVHVDI
nr:neurofilament medium polypeptide-like [Nomia melanderi]